MFCGSSEKERADHGRSKNYCENQEGKTRNLTHKSMRRKQANDDRSRDSLKKVLEDLESVRMTEDSIDL